MLRYIYILPILFLNIFYGACISDKSCSDKDRSCNVIENILYLLPVPQGIYFYSTALSYQGNLAVYGSSLDESLLNICTNNRLFATTINTTCSNILPFVSTPTNGIPSFPGLFGVPDNTSYPIRGARGDIISNTWGNMFTSIQISLQQAGVISQAYWTFAGAGGGYNNTYNCTDGTDTGATGAIGSPVLTATSWLYETSAACSESHPIICLCY
ncbi:hypothetical protein EHQ52_12045 [Leptospira koniambonensis]|uniref:DUF1554 domain-containing protein n=1 Tax=Leptospira koniambonensis TaxID=2484950 RepID=A0A4R9JBD0_9LEPT|nr:hypothetical protein [Leptospira koniambonensis]TGL35201.1 hypothetical protein EHQ52_12045 [Leptospira koniambonensis]